ncbi:hypothetical protein H4219_004782 [Mycoemilia scoparia]|uniref:Uncharacterized protein n=1 Tax=Mycoemilia scoparia TaxID=417184 RepID=A0A9W7ZQG2_9FUNG|nr:hypothetical protein H4219_004782 [Mycoemilia scoparia]
MVKITTDSESKFEPVQGNQDKDAVPTKVVEQQQPQQEQPQDDVDELTNKMNNLELPKVPESGIVELNTWLPDYIAAMETTEATAEEKAVKALEILWDAKLFIQTNPSKTPGFYYPIDNDQLHELLIQMYNMPMSEMAELLEERGDWTSEAFPINVAKPTLFKYYLNKLASSSSSATTKNEASYAVYKFIKRLKCPELEPYARNLLKIYAKGDSDDEKSYEKTIAKICECYTKHYYWGNTLIYGIPFILDDKNNNSKHPATPNIDYCDSDEEEEDDDDRTNNCEFFAKLGFQGEYSTKSELADISSKGYLMTMPGKSSRTIEFLVLHTLEHEKLIEIHLDKDSRSLEAFPTIVVSNPKQSNGGIIYKLGYEYKGVSYPQYSQIRGTTIVKLSEIFPSDDVLTANKLLVRVMQEKKTRR